MQFIAHRINTRAQLAQVPPEYGVEIDLRDRGDRLILQHDPFADGEDFEEYLAGYRHCTLILNIKSERIEHRVLELVRRYTVRDYFFLDSSFPMLVLLSGQGERNLAVRFSEYEGLDSVLSLRGRARWVWVDCFTRLPIDAAVYATLKNAGFKLCLVSPELQGRDKDLEVYRDRLRGEGVLFDAVCTKLHNIPRWQKK